MSRTLASFKPVGQGRMLMGGEPLIFHCNHYNFWLQHTVRLAGGETMDPVIVDAAASVSHALLTAAKQELELESADAVLKLATEVFAELGFGMLDFSAASAEGGAVSTPVSHYGDTLGSAFRGDFQRPQNLFDRGFAAAALAVAHSLPAGGFEVTEATCKSLGAEVASITLTRAASPREIFETPGAGHVGKADAGAPFSDTGVDEGAILQALSGLDFSGNEEGLTPRFGVMLTHHFANFYNRISFEFDRLMSSTGFVEEGETLLIEAGHRCAFNTFGGIMTSAEWDAVVKPQLESQLDWVHGMVAVTNALGWGVWRVHELSETRVVVRIYDDYESCGWLGMYGASERPVSFLATGGVAGMMNLIFPGKIADKPDLDAAFYSSVFEAEDRFFSRQTKSIATGDPYSEIIAERR
jgi:hypothetical protein